MHTHYRDDLQSATFVFLDLLLGKLPWFHEARAKDKARVLAMKQEVCACVCARLGCQERVLVSVRARTLRDQTPKHTLAPHDTTTT